MASSESTPKPPLMERLFAGRKSVSYVLFLVAAAFTGLAIWLGMTWGKNLAPVWLWSGGMAVLALAAGLWLLLYDAPESRGVDDLRMLVLAVGGMTGFLTVCLGLILGYQWWNDILGWMQPGGAERTGTAHDQWLAGLRALLPMPILLVGMAIMFASLQLARTEERNKPVLRRLLYGYNAVLTSLLLLLVLVVVNVFVGVKLQKPLDFTSSTMFTLSDRSVNMLRHLEQPVKVYVILDRGGPATEAVQAMLTNCQNVNDRLQAEYLSPNRQTAQETFEKLSDKVPNLGPGLVVAYGPKDKEEYRYIKADDLFASEFDRFGGGKPKFEFKGEDALMTQLNALMEGKDKPKVIYFVQGHGELDLKDTDPRSHDGAGELKKRLEERSVTVKPLTIDVPDSKVPADAAMVVVAGPTNLIPEQAIKALEEYMNKGGKLLVLLAPTPNRDKSELVKIGLEPFLAKYNVQVGQGRVLSMRNQLIRMRDVLARGNPQQREHALVKPFWKTPFQLVDNTRVIQPAQSGPGGGQRFKAETLLVNYMPAWQETNLKDRPEQLFQDHIQDNADAFKRKLESPLSIAVGVTEMTGPPPNPHMFMQQQPTEQKPRLVVIGNSAIASNWFTNARGAETGYDFLASSMEWLREREGSIGIEPKKHQLYRLPDDTNPWPFFLMPTALILFGVIGTGTGVWLVRRR